MYTSFKMRLTKKTIEEISRHASGTYPEECCGIVTGNRHNQIVHFCQNIQGRLHAEDPEKYPRDARTAYIIDRNEAEEIFSLAKEQRKEVIAFYHSHVDHEAYFSKMDREVQTVFGEPEFPEALQLVVSVRERKIEEIKCFRWNRKKKDFLSISTL
jgi:proteasome lid subunit RPN8/RPN11